MSLQNTGKVLQVIASLDGNNTTVSIVSETGYGLQLHGQGKAKRRPGDTRAPEVGLGLAMARALRAYADKEENAANVLLEQVTAENAPKPKLVEPEPEPEEPEA